MKKDLYFKYGNYIFFFTIYSYSIEMTVMSNAPRQYVNKFIFGNVDDIFTLYTTDNIFYTYLGNKRSEKTITQFVNNILT